ncbi:MAG: SUMF1/EgtB/PvdO family nonheme iron enzyme [Blastocatellia bacterium]
MITRVLIENLNSNRTVADINKLLQNYGPIAWIFIELDANTNLPWGYAYAALVNDEKARILVADSLETSLDVGNDRTPLRIRRVESGPDSYTDKNSILTCPAEYIFSASSLILNDVPAKTAVLLDGITKAYVEVKSKLEITSLLPGKYKLVVKDDKNFIFQQEIQILPLKVTELTVEKDKDDQALPFNTILKKEEKKKSNYKYLVVLISIVILIAGYYYYDTAKTSKTVIDLPPPPPPPKGMVYVPATRFVMGRNTSKDPLGFEIPAHATDVKQEFFIDKTEVTNEQYAEFVTATRHESPPNWKGKLPSKDILNLPVTFVSWQDAVDYCQWRTNKERPCRLPQEVEWELAARGSNSYIYPWGNEWRDALANANKVNDKLWPVGQNPANASPFGALDMVGNVWEWVYNDLELYELSKAPAQPGVKVIRGGAFDSDKEEATGSFRGFLIPDKREYDRTGFRCVCDVVRGQN